MSTFSLGSFRAILGIDTGDYTRGLLSAQSVTAIFGQTFASMVANPVLGGIGLFKDLASSVFAASGRMLTLAESVNELSVKSGLSAETIQTLRHGLTSVGSNAAAADNAINQFTVRLGDAHKDGGALVNTMRQLGIDISGLGSGEQALRRVVDQLAAIEDPALKAAAAQELFGRQAGPDLAQLLSKGTSSMDQMRSRYERIGLVLKSDTITNLSAFENQVESVGQAWQGISQSLTAEFLEALGEGFGDASGGIDSFAVSLRRDLAPAAQLAGQSIVPLARALGEAADGLRSLIELIDLAKSKQGVSGPSDRNWMERNFPFLSSLADVLAEAVTPDVGIGTEYRRRRRADRGRR